MVRFAQGLSERGLNLLTFNFLYAEQRRRVPDRMPQLVACYEAVIAAAREHLPIRTLAPYTSCPKDNEMSEAHLPRFAVYCAFTVASFVWIQWQRASSRTVKAIGVVGIFAVSLLVLMLVGH